MAFFQGHFPSPFFQREKFSFLSPSFPTSDSLLELKTSEIQYKGVKYYEEYI